MFAFTLFVWFGCFLVCFAAVCLVVGVDLVFGSFRFAFAVGVFVFYLWFVA